jgi:hypothetical protein
VALATLIAPEAAASQPPAPPLWSPDILFAEHLRIGISAAATLLLVWGALLRWADRPGAQRRLRDGLLIGLTLMTLFAWVYPYRGGFGTRFHFRDAYHYYLGSKYFRELAYTHLYECTVIADAEAGRHEELAGSVIRDLETNRLREITPVLADPGRCKRNFSAARWRAFARDVHWFRQGLRAEVWQGLRTDHGYNPPPAWGILGTLLTNTGAAGLAQLRWLTLLDPLLLALTFGAIAWAFGWRVTCVALLFWGTNQTARWEWVGGSILRFDWLAASLGGICCLRRGHPRAAGLLLAYATCLRVFPLLIAGALGLAALLRMLRTRSLRPSGTVLHFAIGFASGILIAVALSSWIAGSYRSWIEFANNSRLHLASPSVNLVGLRTLVSYDPDQRSTVTFDYGLTDPFARWRTGQSETFARRQAIFSLLVVAYLALLALALWRRSDDRGWITAALGVGLIPVVTQLSCYYLSILMAFALLWALREEIGAALMLLAAASWWTRCGLNDCDVMYVWHSGAMLIFVAFATLLAAAAPPNEPARSRDPTLLGVS